MGVVLCPIGSLYFISVVFDCSAIACCRVFGASVVLESDVVVVGNFSGVALCYGGVVTDFCRGDVWVLSCVVCMVRFLGCVFLTIDFRQVSVKSAWCDIVCLGAFGF